MKRIVLAAVAAIVIVGVIFWIGHSPKKETAAKKDTTTTTTPVATPPPTSEPAELSLAQKLELATVGKGEGIEHTLIRQLMADPTLVKTDGKKGTTAFDGDLDDKAARKKWAGRQADILARNAGLVTDEDFGAQVRILQPNQNAFLFVADENNNLSILKYTMAAPDKGFEDSPAPTDTYQVADGISNAHFIGLSASIQTHPLSPDLYIYTG